MTIRACIETKIIEIHNNMYDQIRFETNYFAFVTIYCTTQDVLLTLI